MTTPATQNINLALSAIMADIEAIGKTRKNDAQGFSFRGIEDFMNELHPVFAAHGVTCVPSVEKAEHHNAGLTKSGAVITRAVVTMRYHLTASDGSTREGSMIGEGLDSGDKATPKAISMALKSFLQGTFLVPTADVVDADYYSPTVDAREQLALQNRDKKIIQQLIDQHIADSELAETTEEKKRLQGLAAELRCKLHDLDVTQSEEAKPEATTVETEILPPAGDLPEKKTRQKKTEPNWQDIECHIGKAGGPVLGKKLGELFKPDASQKHMDTLVGWFHAAVSKSTAPKDRALWNGVQEAQKAWQAAQPAAEPQAATAKQTKWSEYVVTSKIARFNGRKLGDMTPDEHAEIDAQLDKIDMAKATLTQKTLRAMLTLALADTRTEAQPDHTEQLNAAIADSKLNRNDLMAVAKKNGWISADAEKIEDITEDEATTLLSDWETVADAIKAEQP